MYSIEGYKRNSPDRHNPFNIIKSNRITMKDVEFPVMGVSNTGHKILMQPGQDYVFDGDYVIEFPVMQKGGVSNASNRTPQRPITSQTQSNDLYQWSDAPVNNIPLSTPFGHGTSQPNSNVSSTNIRSIQEQIDIANKYAETLDPVYEKQLRDTYNTTPHQVLYEYDEDYKNMMSYNASQNPDKIQYSSTDLRRGDNVAPNTEWMYPNLTGQTRSGMTTQANQDLAFDIMGSGMANQYFKSTSTLNTLLRNGLKSTYYKKAPWTWKPDPDAYYRLGKTENMLQDVMKTGKISANNNVPDIIARSKRFPELQIKQKTFPEADTYWAKGVPLDRKYGPKNQYYGNYLIEASDDIPFVAAVNQKTKQKGFWNAPDVNYNNTHIEGQYVKPRQSYAYDELGKIKPSEGTPLIYNETDFKLLEPHWFYGYKEYKPKLQRGGTAGMDGMMKARLAIDSHFGNPTARRMTNYDTRSYEFPDGNKGNVYVSSYDNLVTPQIQDVNGKLMFIDNPWSEENADRSYNQSMKFERDEDAQYFGENYKKYAPMMRLYKKQEGGTMNEEIIRKIQEALQQGVTPEQLVKELQKQGVSEQEAIQMVSAAMPQQEQMQQYQYGTTVRHNYADNINYDNKFNATALGLNAVSDPRNMTWALPDTGFGSGMKAISGLASGLAGSYLGYAKMFSKDKVTNNTPNTPVAISKNPKGEIQAPYMGTDSEKALPTPWGKEQTLPDWLNPYNGNPNIQGTNQYSTYKQGGMKKYQDGDFVGPIDKIPGEPFKNPWDIDYNINYYKAIRQYEQDQMDYYTDLYNKQYPDNQQKPFKVIDDTSYTSYYDKNSRKKQSDYFKFLYDNIVFDDSNAKEFEDPNAEIKFQSARQADRDVKENYKRIKLSSNMQLPKNYFNNEQSQGNQFSLFDYTIPLAEYVANAQNIGNMDFTGNLIMNDGRGLNFSNPSNPLNKTSEQLKKEKQNKPKSNSTITSMNDDALGFQIANNALIGFQNFNDVVSAKDYEKEYNQMLMRTGNTDKRYNPLNPTNPYGMYTPNAGIGSNYGLVANSYPQDFGTSMASAKCGGMKKYQEGGEYNLTQEEIDFIIKNGGEIEIID